MAWQGFAFCSKCLAGELFVAVKDDKSYYFNGFGEFLHREENEDGETVREATCVDCYERVVSVGEEKDVRLLEDLFQNLVREYRDVCNYDYEDTLRLQAVCALILADLEKISRKTWRVSLGEINDSEALFFFTPVEGEFEKLMRTAMVEAPKLFIDAFRFLKENDFLNDSEIRRFIAKRRPELLFAVL